MVLRQVCTVSFNIGKSPQPLYLYKCADLIVYCFTDAEPPACVRFNILAASFGFWNLKIQICGLYPDV